MRPDRRGICIVVDVHHDRWDPRIRPEFRRTSWVRLLGIHFDDWLLLTRGLLADRGMMRNEATNIPRIRGWVEDAGYSEPVEVEIFSKFDLWHRDPDEVVGACIERCRTDV